ncbi:MAG: glucosidase [Acidimicrobiales bacterium]
MARAERDRLEGDQAGDWHRWGPYLSERAWGTVREDYSADGSAWESFPHDHARSRAYRWNEDGMAGICDDHQQLCLAFAFWNGRDPILKERPFGLTGHEGRHGEDVKEYWFYLDSTPTHSWMRWRYLYPQAAYPYAELLAGNAARTRHDPEYELLDTGVFDDGRYWELTVDYAKAATDDVCVRVSARNAGPDQATLSVLPTLWFRNVWSWGIDDPRSARPQLHRGEGASVVADHPALGTVALAGDGSPEGLFCENETNVARLWGGEPTTPYPKDGINDHVVSGAPTVNPAGTGTKAALHYRLTVDPGQTAEIRLRLAPVPGAASALDLTGGWEATLVARETEADEFYRSVAPAAPPAEAAVVRQALAGMLWSKQLYHYDVARWLDGDPAFPPPPPSRGGVRNGAWRHLNNFDVISMPDTWEYPWYAAWDLAFHCVALAHVDPAFAKDQLVLLCREWYMHPNGQLPAYEWEFSDVNPPVHAWAALRVFEIDGSRDFEFLERVMHKLLLNFTWWVNRKDSEGNNVFEGGFLGLDNIGPIDRSKVPGADHLEQADGTAWMAMYCLDLLEMSLVLADHDHTYEDLATKFFEHFAYIARAIHAQGLWDEGDGFYYDVLHHGSGEQVPVRVRSMVGLIPLYAVTTLGEATLARLPAFAARFHWFLDNYPEYDDVIGHVHALGGNQGRLLSIVSPDRLVRILVRMLDDDEFLSPHGLRALSRYHRDHPFTIDLGGSTATCDYEPAESTVDLFGGNSNWRGPVWFPVNHLAIEALRRYFRYFGTDLAVELPTGSGRTVSLGDVADELSRRLVALFLDDAQGRRPVFGGYERFQSDPAWHGLLPFHEYFHGDTGAGLGASHQTGWTGLVADLVIRARSGAAGGT